MSIRKMISVALVAGVLAPAAFAAQVDLCTGQTPGADAVAAVPTGAGHYVQTSFTAKCSANVFMSMDDNNNALAVASASKKGRTIFAGHTNGGAVTKTTAVCAAVATTGCATSDLNGPLSTALTAASSS